MPELKLLALDAEDLNVVSAHAQDAIVRVGDMTFLPRDRRFAAVISRFDWIETHSSGRARRPHARRRAALRFERVLAARTSGIDLKKADDILVLLAVGFAARGDGDPAGTVTLTFAGQAAVQLDVECIEAELRDLGPAWATRARPSHPLDEGSGS